MFSYPHFPIVTQMPLSRPFFVPNPQTLQQYNRTEIFYNFQNASVVFDGIGLDADSEDPGHPVPGCSNDDPTAGGYDGTGDGSKNTQTEDTDDTLTIDSLDSLAPASTYPQDYLTSYQSWKEDLGLSAPLSGKDLRTLTLGDSITFGYLNSGSDSYRTYLSRLLSDNTKYTIYDGPNGTTISNISSLAPSTYPPRPNIVLLHAGTYDMSIPSDPYTAPQRLSDLIDQMLVACPDTPVLVAMVIPAADPATQARIVAYNDAIPDVVTEKINANQPVGLVDMNSAFTVSDLQDGLHPTDKGYEKMAGVWFNALKDANAYDLIKPPADLSIS